METLARVLELALDVLRKTNPNDLKAAMNFVAGLDSNALPSDPLETLVEHLGNCGPNDRILHALTLAIHAWDHEIGPSWTQETAQHSSERRNVILKLLRFDSSQWDFINARILRFTEAEVPIVIAEAHKPWYHDRKREIRDFYWNHYRTQLEVPKGSWKSDAIDILDASTDDVISRLSDPTLTEIYPVKGLVMGYVQSGKTSHFSGLIAKAADAGYRLIIVLAGTTDILRQQTQRRIDKEIVGRELLGDEEYGRDADWLDFVAHKGIPSELGYFDWERLTNKDDDYKTLSKHLSILEFKRLDRTKPFNHPDNLRTASTKVVVIKKVPAIIKKLCNDLKRLSELRSALEHVPTLVIDDESDQASVNTIDQTKPGKQGKRTSTNKEIGNLLKMLPRAQYVGYTATPFANVFINPEDAEDLFPKDFIISLSRPKGYMGVSDFYDFDTKFEKSDFNGNRNAFVRPVEGDNEAPNNLPAAIDSYILAGAIKLYREHRDPEQYRFRHHTMLVHHEVKQIVHEEDRQIVERIFMSGARYQRQEGLEKLRALFLKDFVPVSNTRAPDAPFPKNFEELRPFISQCVSRVCAEKSVRVVNGEGRNRDDTPEFDQVPVWAILVGGTKLSRGYTVEGLTVSYYRRPTGAGDTLMQMGRWFGFRTGYQDLVRLFIGSKEPKGRVTVDLYEAFGAVCRDEEALRKELLKYAKGGLVPKQVPPLVSQHLPQLPPTSRNKMFNAVIRSRDFAGEWTEKTSAPTQYKHIKANKDITVTLLNKSEISPHLPISFTDSKGSTHKFNARIGVASGGDILTFLKGYTWANGRESISLEIEYVEMMLEKNKLKKWLIMLPQLGSGKQITLEGAKSGPFSTVVRARVSESRFGAYSDPSHRAASIFLGGGNNVQNPSESLLNNRDTEAPVLLMYFVEEAGNPKSEISIGFGINYPGQKTDKAITWTVRDRNNEDAVVV